MLAITAAWGSCFVAIDWGLRDSPVLWFAAFRSLFAGIVLVGVAQMQHRTRPHGLTSWGPSPRSFSAKGRPTYVHGRP